MWKSNNTQGRFSLVSALAVLSMIFLTSSTAAAATPMGPSAAKDMNPKLAEVINKAAKEKEVSFQGPTPRTGFSAAEMVADMERLVKEQFGAEIKVQYDHSLFFNAATAKVLTEITAGSPPSYDLLQQNVFASGLPLYAAKALEPIPWRELFPWITEKDLVWNGQAALFETQFVLPEYNTKLVKPADVPKSWDDLLDPKWKGKLSVLVYPDPWALLAQPSGWGKEKMFAYLKKLLQLNPKIGRFPEVHTWVVSGETPMAWGNQRERGVLAQQKGAPIDFAAKIDPIIGWPVANVVPKGARHPNAAALLASVFLTEAGQQHMLKFHNSGSMFRPNTSAAKFAEGRSVLMPDTEWQLREGLKMHKEIGTLLTKR